MNRYIKNLAIKYMPDIVFAQVYSRINNRNIKIERDHNGWRIIGDKYTVISPTAKFTAVSMAEFEDKFEKYFKIKKGDKCLDVGACIGDTTLPMCIKTGIFGIVYAVEPNKVNFKYLTINTEYRESTKLLEMAVWKEKGELILHEHNTPTGHSLISWSLRKKETIVKTDTLDNLFKNEIIDFAKIDVQHAEIEVLGSADKFLKSTRKLIVECHHDYKKELHDTSKEVESILSGYYSNLEYSDKYNLFYAWR